jgi:integral membrane protein (TIGR01906 family)
MKHDHYLVRALSVIVSFLTPLTVLMLAIRILIMPSYAQFAYSLPGFPDDPYGFLSEDRLHWSRPSIDYLINTEDISFLADLSFNDGEPIFNTRELSHMEDVKMVVTGMRVALGISLAALFVITIVAFRGGWRQMLINAFHQGGWAVIGLIVAIFLLVAVNFNSLFTWFHQIFFESGTWQFHPSDTLIRLFPMRFWRDAFILVGLISLMMGGLVVFVTRDKFHLEK